MSYKLNQIIGLRKAQDELLARINGLPIFQSDILMASVKIKFAVEEVVDALEKVDWAEPAPFKSVEQVAAERIPKQAPETTEVVAV